MRRKVENINAYLLAMDDVYVSPSCECISPSLPPMTSGDVPGDYGNLTLTSDEVGGLTVKHPELKPYIKKLLNIRLTGKGIDSYILYLEDASQSVIRLTEIQRRLGEVSLARSQGAKQLYKDYAQFPHRFIENRYKSCKDLSNEGVTIAFPRVTSSLRRYIPIEVYSCDVIAPRTYQVVYNSPLWLLSVLSSSLFTVWLRTTSGRTKNDFMLSVIMTYNTFPLPSITREDEGVLTDVSERILWGRDADDSCLSVQYDNTTMPRSLFDIHRENDKIVERVVLGRVCKSDEERLALLLENYQAMTVSKDSSTPSLSSLF